MSKILIKTGFCVVVLVAFGVVSCKKTTVEPTDEATVVNGWILEQMKTYYLWNDKIPTNVNLTLTPDKYFDAILYKYDATLRPDGDRFSWIEPEVAKLEASLAGESTNTGADFQLYSKTNSEEIAGRITLVQPNSPADKAGLKRGDIFTKFNVDGQLVTKTNYSTLLSQGKSYEFTLGSYTNGSWVSTATTKTSEAIVLQKDPLYLDSVYSVGTKKIGYLVYNQFVATPSGGTSPTYNLKMDKIFARFKAAGINELVLDFRYNPGGYSTASLNLASLVARGATKDKIFSKRQWNATITPALEKQYGADFFLEKFTEKTENVGANLPRVFVLTSKRSASASELVINGLKPYMDVVVIGDVTYGKNVGSITIKDDKGRFKWGLQPIVMRSANALGSSDYASGFKPLVTVIENVSEPMYAFGDRRDPLLNEAMFQITGTRTARRGVTTEDGPQPFATTFDGAAGSGLVIELK
jgi:carboxyl-terminal processing protease